jgi:hypothetical protein
LPKSAAILRKEYEMAKHMVRAWLLACIALISLAAPKATWSAPPDFAPYCSKADYIYTGQNESPERQENLCLGILAQSVSRRGDILTLQFANGTSKAFQNGRKACDNDDANHCISYWLVGYHQTARLYLADW